MTRLGPRSRGKVGSLPGEFVSGQDGCPRVQGGKGRPRQLAWPVLPRHRKEQVTGKGPAVTRA